MLELLRHQLKEKLRSSFWQKSLWLNILLAILGLYLLVNIGILGYMADTIIEKIFPFRNPVEAFSGLIFYYLLIDLLIRFLFVKIPALSIRPYLTLPVKKSTLIHYPLIKSIPTFFNLFPLLLIIPFFVKVVCKDYPVYFCAGWLITALSFVLFNIFLNFSLKKFFIKRPLLIFLLIVLTCALLYFEIKGYSSFSGYFSTFIFFLSSRPFLVFIPVTVAGLSYFLGYSILRKNAYLEEYHAVKKHLAGDLTFLSKYGEPGILLRNEIRLILRNPRPKSLFIFGLLFFIYLVIMYLNLKGKSDLIIFICLGYIATNMIPVAYGQYTFGWEGGFFDFYLANDISTFNFIKSKYLLFAITGTISFLLTLPFAFFNYRIAWVNLMMLIFNIGITSIIMIFLCTFNSKRMDMSQVQFMNYQGTGVLHFLMVFPVFGFPALLFLIAWLFGDIHYVIYLFAITGILGIIFYKYLVKMLARQFLRRKYKMSMGFRQN